MTYSIVARDAETGELGVGVQSQAFNTGAAVPWALPGVGAVATQSFTDRRYGVRGLVLLAAGAAPQDALDTLRAADEHPGLRQVGMLAADGRGAQWTGADCVPSAGEEKGDGWVAQANMVDSPQVWTAMGDALEATDGPLPLRLLAALEAAEAAGGDWRGRGGAAILVVPATGEPWERVVDLRVEEGDDSLVVLRRLVERALGYRAASRANADRAQVGAAHGLPERHVRLLALEDAVRADRLDEARAILASLETEDARWRDAVRTMAQIPGNEPFGRILG